LFEEPVEEHASGSRSTAVEAERELVKVCLHVSGLDAALVSAKQPALGERSDAVHARSSSCACWPEGPIGSGWCVYSSPQAGR